MFHVPSDLVASSLKSCEASSSRKIDQEDLDLESLAHQAFQEAATFASVCMDSVSSEVIKQSVRAWWAETGKELLVAFSQCEGEDAKDESEAFSTTVPFF